MATWTDYDCERDAELALTELTGTRYHQRIEGEHQAEQDARRVVARSWQEISVEPDREPEAELSW
jgi:hypothetical protein